MSIFFILFLIATAQYGIKASATGPDVTTSFENFGIIDLEKTDYKNPLIISTSEGIGVKFLLADETFSSNPVKDLVALCANNLLEHGAEPVNFINYLSAGNIDIPSAMELVQEMQMGSIPCKCTLTRNEVAQLADTQSELPRDLTGFATGIVERDQMLPMKNLIQPGDAVIGLASSGVHANGFSIIRKIIEDYGIDTYDKPPYISLNKTFAQALLEPTVSYVSAVLPLCKQNKLKAIAHITKGGLIESIPRVLPNNVGVQLDSNKWHIPSVFRWIKYQGNINTDVMHKTYNLGIGMVLIVSQKDAHKIVDHLCNNGVHSSVIGFVTKSNNQKQVTIRGEIPNHALKVMVIGNGAREHALAWKLAQSPYVGIVCVAPGNGGTSQEKKVQNIPINLQHNNAVITYAQQNKIDFIIVGPEAPLANGFVDSCRAKGVRCFGPTKDAAQIETSKAFAKEFMTRHNIPTAPYQTFTDFNLAQEFIKKQKNPIVIKADGLAGGKGVVIAQTHDQAIKAAQEMLSGKLFGDAGKKIIVEQFLWGEEVSFIVMTDGEHIVPFPTSQDYKKRDNGDRGPNTGGMGAYSPAPIVTNKLHDRIMKEIITPAIEGMKKENKPFTGFLYAGLMISKTNDPYVLEFNCRLGDPEAEPLMMRLKSDLAVMCTAALNKQLDRIDIDWDPRPALAVVLTAGGYPLKYRKGDTIIGIPETGTNESKLFHGGTAFQNGTLVTNGGRILCATSLGNNMETARAKTYALARSIYWPDINYRNDIGYKAICAALKQ